MARIFNALLIHAWLTYQKTAFQSFFSENKLNFAAVFDVKCEHWYALVRGGGMGNVASVQSRRLI